MTTSPRLLDGPVGPTLTRLALPMLFGIVAVILFNVVDTFWVGRLGVRELAAMSYTFPVVFVVLSLSMGIGIGATAIISRAIGDGDAAAVRRLTTHSLVLANILVIAVALIGLATIGPLFGAMGASPEMIGLIDDYMVPWFWGVGLLVIPMVGNSAIRATGDTKTPSILMIIAGGVNIILDPLLIFGIGPFPRLELQGAAVATLISWIVIFVAALWILARRERMLEARIPPLTELWDSWRRILYVGLPTAATFVLMPIAGGIITRMASGFGEEAVAAYGVSQRIEALATVGVGALATAVTPFAGQNFGAGRWDRLDAAFRFAVKLIVAWSVAVAVLLALGSSYIGAIFSDNPTVIALVADYVLIVPLTYTGFGALGVVSALYNGINRPLRSASLSLFRLFVLTIPLAHAGSLMWGTSGLFVGIAVGNVIAGVVAVYTAERLLRTERPEQVPRSGHGPAPRPVTSESR